MHYYVATWMLLHSFEESDCERRRNFSALAFKGNSNLASMSPYCRDTHSLQEQPAPSDLIPCAKGIVYKSNHTVEQWVRRRYKTTTVTEL